MSPGGYTCPLRGFPQRQYVAYVPNRPDATFAEMPPGDEDITMDFILLEALPNFFIANFQISFAVSARRRASLTGAPQPHHVLGVVHTSDGLQPAALLA